MKSTEVLERLDPLTKVEIRNIDHTPDTKVLVVEDRLAVKPSASGRTIVMGKEGTESLVKYCGVPPKLGKDLTTDTYGRVLTECLAHRAVEHPYGILMREGVGMGIAHGGQKTIQVAKLVQVIDKNLPGVDYFDAKMMGADTGIIEVLGERQEPVVRGDLVSAGVMVKFSPAGAIKPYVQAYAVRRVCMNGATSNTIIRELTYTGGEGDDVWQWFRTSLKEAYGGFDQTIGEYRRMIGENVPPEQRAAVLEALLRQAKISGKPADAIRARALQEPPRNAYDMFNLITWGATYAIERPQAQLVARNAAAEFSSVTEHARICPVCHSGVRARRVEQVS